jgi:hypothetical protein
VCICMASGHAAGSLGPIVIPSSVDFFEKHLLKKYTRWRSRYRRSGVLIPTKVRDFLASLKSRPALEPPRLAVLWVPGFSPVGKAARA